MKPTTHLDERNGESCACAELVDRYGASIFRLARHCTRSQGDAEELLQGTFLEACAELDCLRDAARPRPWLIRIAVRRARDMNPAVWTDDPVGAEREASDSETARWADLPLTTGPWSENRENLDRALNSLRPILRVAFVLRDMEGLSTGEIAAMLDLPERMVRRLLMLARLQLREGLIPYLGANSPEALPGPQSPRAGSPGIV